MASFHVQYTREIREQLNYVATWLPTVKLVPGDVCDMRGNELIPMSRLEEFGVKYETEDRPVDTDVEYSSAGSVSVNFKAKGEPPPLGSILKVEEAGVCLSFGRSGAVLLRLAKCFGKRLKSLHAVGEQVLRLHQDGRWPEGYVVVAETLEAGASTIIISQDAEAGVDLVAKAGIGQGPLTLASLDAGLQVKRESKIGAKFVAMPGLTPLVRVSGIKKRVIWPDQFKGVSKPPELGFEDVGYADYAP